VFVPGFFNFEVRDGHLFGSLVDTLRNSTPTVALAIGMTLVIATGGVDLSVGAIMAIAASVACILIDPRIVGLNLQGDTTAVVGDPTYSFVGPLSALTAARLRDRPALRSTYRGDLP
jgi:simple sugar transport system permease protein